MRLDEKYPVLLDGGMGTQLQARGIQPGEIPELLNLTKPDWIADIHRSYIAAGSRVIYSNTFGVNRLKLRDTGHSVAEVVSAGVRLAKEAAAGTDTRVAVDIGPLGALLEPLGSLPFEEALDLFAEIAEAGEAAGADLAVIETMTDLQEARAALLAVKERTQLPVFVTMSFDANGRTFTGCTVASMARTLEGLGADAIGVNCSLGPTELLSVVAELSANTRLPLIVKPNAGLPDPTDGHYSLGPEAFREAMRPMLAAGAAYVGGCCGTGPEHIRALAGILSEGVPREPAELDSFLCTASQALPVNRARVIGERINPTGKKRMQQALLENDMDYLAELALQQADAGAEILDVNVGYPGVDEVAMLPRAVRAIQAVTDIPLQLDSANPEALEAGLRVYCGKASVNSVNGKEESLRTVLPLVKKYGASVVGLTLDEEGIPATAEQRFGIAERILARAQALGIPREDVWIDCLTLTVSAQQEQAEETLRAVRMVTEQLRLRTVLGVSNISFGLPNRLLMTQTFLVRALQAGLTLPIVNPNQREIMDAIAAHRVLSGDDAQCGAYIARFADTAPAPKTAEQPRLTLEEAILRGLRADAGRLTRQELETRSEMELVEGVLIPALDRVGEDYERGKVFLPQLLSAAQAAQAVFEEIRQAMLRQGRTRAARGKILIATVQGDIHDIGKNIVKTLLENYGYDVTDLGKDVPPEVITQTAREGNYPLVGLSALMTTTLPAMSETVRQLKALPQPPAVMVGGAVVTEEYARSIGADCYARDARAAARYAQGLFG